MPPRQPRKPRPNYRPAPAPKPGVTHVPAPPRAAAPRGWTLRVVALATRPGDTLTADAYVSPDGRTAVHRGCEHVGAPRGDVPRYVVAVVVGGTAWATADVTSRASRHAVPLATRAAAANAGSARELALMDRCTPGSRLWVAAVDGVRAAHVSAGAYGGAA